MNIRIIPRLDIKGPNLVKGIHFEGLRVLGKPEDFARHYYEHGADELIYQDAVASLYGRNSLLDIVKRTSREVFIPLCVGGGLRSLEDIRRVLRAGADKVALNTAAVERPELISEAAQAFGSSTIVVSIEAMRQNGGGYEAFVDFGRQSTGVDAVQWAERAVELGAGELLVTSINQEGTGKGYDLDLTRKIAESVSVPVIALGGERTGKARRTTDHLLLAYLPGPDSLADIVREK
jgi:imidazole glycerol-phosphate synthase subunit HisF